MQVFSHDLNQLIYSIVGSSKFHHIKINKKTEIFLPKTKACTILCFWFTLFSLDNISRVHIWIVMHSLESSSFIFLCFDKGISDHMWCMSVKTKGGGSPNMCSYAEIFNHILFFLVQNIQPYSNHQISFIISSPKLISGQKKKDKNHRLSNSKEQNWTESLHICILVPFLINFQVPP